MLNTTSCEKSEISYYNDEYAAVKFPDNYLRDGYSGYSTMDNMFYASYSFLDNGTSTQASIIYELPVMLIGNTAIVNRKIAYSIDQEMSTAPEGSFEIIEAVIPANEFKGYIQIKLNNVEELEETTYILTILLDTSDDLTKGPKEYIKAELSWNNQIPAPTTNNYVRSYNMLIKGETNFVSTSRNSYSNRALRVIVDALNWNDWNIQGAHAYYNADGYKYLPRYTYIYNDNSYQSYSMKVDEYIKAYNAAHPDAPLLHDGGKNVGLPIEARSSSN